MDNKWINIFIYVLVAVQFICWIAQHYALSYYFDVAVVGKQIAWRNYFTLNSLQGLSVFSLLPIIPYAYKSPNRYVKYCVFWLFVSSIYLVAIDWYYYPVRNYLKPYYYYFGSIYFIVLLLVEFKRRKKVYVP